jgi:hypothetical protein
MSEEHAKSKVSLLISSHFNGIARYQFDEPRFRDDSRGHIDWLTFLRRLTDISALISTLRTLHKM